MADQPGSGAMPAKAELSDTANDASPGWHCALPGRNAAASDAKVDRRAQRTRGIPHRSGVLWYGQVRSGPAPAIWCVICSDISAAAAWFRWDGAYYVMILFARF